MEGSASEEDPPTRASSPQPQRDASPALREDRSGERQPEETLLFLGRSASGDYRLQTRELFLTYPRADVEKEEFAAALREVLPTAIWMKVAKETHQDGVPHLHVLVLLSTRLRARSARFADCLGLHGNYAAVRSFPHAAEYLSKEDTSPLIWPATPVPDAVARLSKRDRAGTSPSRSPSRKKKKPSASQQIAEKIRAGESTKDLAKSTEGSLLGWMIMNLKKAKDYETELRSGIDLLPWPRIKSSLTTQDSKILRWLGLQLDTQRPLKTKNLWLTGPANSGKTTFLETLAASIKTYKPCSNEKYWDGYDDSYDLIVFDEFDEKWWTTISEMNRVADGQVCRLPQKGVGAYWKRRNLPVIVASNYLPEDAWKSVTELQRDTLYARFDVIELTNFISIFE